MVPQFRLFHSMMNRTLHHDEIQCTTFTFTPKKCQCSFKCITSSCLWGPNREVQVLRSWKKKEIYEKQYFNVI